MNSLIGEQIAGEYEILEALGNGASSVVYKAMRVTDSKFFAIKMLHSYLVEKEDTRKRFEQEAKAAMLLSHPNIVKVHGLNTTSDGQPYLIMDYVEGTTLADLVSKDGGIFLPRAWKLFIQIADAMNHAHSHGVVHRSLKPGNIIITKNTSGEENALISDFGLAKLLPSSGQEIQQLTAKGAVVGSPLFMSPEQCLGREIDGRADIYSMGCLMYTCISGKPPFKGENILDTMSKHVSEVPLTFENLCPELKIPDPVQSIVFKCMAKRPEDRYENMDLLKQDLVRFQQGKRPKALSSHSNLIQEKQSRPEPEIDDERFLKIALAAILALLVGLVIYAIWKTPQHKNPDEIELGHTADHQRKTHPISALALLKQADELHMMHRDDEARAMYREAILKAEFKSGDQKPVDKEVLATAHYGLAVLYSKSHHWNEAEKELRLALYVQGLAGSGAAPGEERIEIDLADSLMHQGKLTAAKQLLAAVLKESTDTLVSARSYLMLSDIAHISHDDTVAQRYQTQALEILKSQRGLARKFYGMILCRRANILIDQKQFEKCSAMLKDALSERPSFAWDAYDTDTAIVLTSELARLMVIQNDYNGAINVCRKLIQTINTTDSQKKRLSMYTPETGILLDCIAAAQVLSADEKAANKTLEDLLFIDGDHLGRIATRARILVYTKHTDEAISLLSKYKFNSSKQISLSAEHDSLMAVCLSADGNNAEALKQIEQSLETLRHSDDEALTLYCLRVKCQILRALKRDDAADLIGKTIGPPSKLSAPFDFLVPPYQRQGYGA